MFILHGCMDCNLSGMSALPWSPFSSCSNTCLLCYFHHPLSMFPSSLSRVFCPFLTTLSLRCRHLGCGAQSCPVVGCLEPAVPGLGQPWPLLTEATLQPPLPVPCDMHRLANVILFVVWLVKSMPRILKQLCHWKTVPIQPCCFREVENNSSGES